MLRLGVLIPAKNESLVLRHTIESLIRAGVAPCDIHVVDDGSTDDTSSIARAYGVWVLRNEVNIGKAGSIKRATGYFNLIWQYDLISLMDADTRVDMNYFDEVRNCFSTDEKIAVVCGQTKSLPYNWLTAYRCFAYFFTNLIYKRGQHVMGVINVAPGCATTYRSSIFLDLEWRSDTIVEDMDVTIQVHRKKLGKIAFANKAVVHTQDPKTIRDYVRQIYRWYTGAWQVMQMHKMFLGLEKIDLECKLLMGEGFLFALNISLLPIWLVLFPHKVFFILVVDFAFVLAMAIAAGISEKRKDVILYLPAFQILRYVDCVVFLYSFWNAVIRKKKVLEWSFINRYSERPTEAS